MFSTKKSIWIDNYQKITAEEPQWNPACVIPMDLLFEHIFWSEKNVPQHCENIFFFYFASLLWWPIDLLKWFPETSGAKRYCTELSQGDRIKAEISELTFHSVRCEIKSAFPLTKYQFSPEKSHCNDESQQDLGAICSSTHYYLCWIRVS